MVRIVDKRHVPHTPAPKPHTTAQHLAMIASEIGGCGCGFRRQAVELSVAILKTLADDWDGRRDRLMKLAGSPVICHLLLGVLDAAGLIEHGTSVTGSWPTAKGRWVLRHADLIVQERESGVPGTECTDACWEPPLATSPRPGTETPWSTHEDLANDRRAGTDPG